MTAPIERPDPPSHGGSTRRRITWSVLGLVALGFLAWHRLPRLAHRSSGETTFTRTAAGDVKITSPTSVTSPRAGRVSNLPQFVVQYNATVTFAPGSAALTGASAKLLDKLVDKGDTLPGYLIEVSGFADATESPHINSSLQAARADSVIAYLTRVHSVPVVRIVNATGLDTSTFDPHARPRTKAPATNRRAEVKVVMNRAAAPVR